MASSGTFIRSFSTIGRVTAPVEDHVIYIVYRTSAFRIYEIMVKTRIAAVVVCQKVMMESDICTSPYTSIPMISFHMYGASQTLRDKTVLQRKIGITIATNAEINRVDFFMVISFLVVK